MKDLLNQKFNYLTVIKLTKNYKALCRCKCGKELEIRKAHLKSGHTKSCGCLRKEKCSKLNKIGSINSRLIDGKQKTGTGYIYLFVEEHPFSNKRSLVLEHRLVMEKYLKRYLTKQEVVHHKNRVRNDNEIYNLMLFKDNSEHIKFHKLKKCV